MNNNLETTCKICGHQYHVCEKCIKLRQHMSEPWRLHACSPQCHEIYDALKMFEFDNSKKDEAISVISERIEFYSKFGYDISVDYNTLAPELKPVYVALYGEPEQEIIAEELAEEPVVETVVETFVETTDVVVEDVAEEQPVEKESKNEYVTSVYGFKHKKKHK